MDDELSHADERARACTEAILSCPVRVSDDTASLLAALEREDRFEPAPQRALSAAHLLDVATRSGRSVVHEVVGPLGTMVTLVWLGERLAAIGPYTARALRAGEAQEILGRLRLPGSLVEPYRLHRARFPIVDPEYAVRGALALAAMHEPGAAELEVRSVGPEATVGATGEPPQSASYGEIDERYEIERDFMRAVAEGDERGALGELRRMAGLPHTPGYLDTPYLGATILRILSRVAAQQGGLPAVSIDAISQTFAQRLHRRRFSPTDEGAAEELALMVAEFCRQIRRHRQQGRTWLVRRVVDQIELHLSADVSPGDLAARLGVSPSHLARRFKAETGRTIAQYVAGVRAERAAYLLVTTNQQVRDIAAHVGYLDANYFVKVFKAHHGVTPSAYRAAHEG